MNFLEDIIKSKHIHIFGESGSGKTITAIYLLKLFNKIYNKRIIILNKNADNTYYGLIEVDNLINIYATLSLSDLCKILIKTNIIPVVDCFDYSEIGYINDFYKLITISNIDCNFNDALKLHTSSYNNKEYYLNYKDNIMNQDKLKNTNNLIRKIKLKNI